VQIELVFYFGIDEVDKYQVGDQLSGHPVDKADVIGIIVEEGVDLEVKDEQHAKQV